MKYYFSIYIILSLIACKGIQGDVKIKDPNSVEYKLKDIVDNSVATFICVRHAEKEADKKDPGLTSLGKERASDLSDILDHISLDIIFSSNLHRTKMTALPTSKSQNLVIKFYDPSDMKALSDQLLTDYIDKTVLVVGHSNTTPQLANLLTDIVDYTNIPHEEYDQLYVVAMNDNGEFSQHRLEFGKPSPQEMVN